MKIELLNNKDINWYNYPCSTWLLTATEENKVYRSLHCPSFSKETVKHLQGAWQIDEIKHNKNSTTFNDTLIKLIQLILS